MKELVILHCVGTYLPNTENWLYRLIISQPGKQYVAAHKFIECDFYSNDVTYLRTSINYRRPSLFIRTWNRIFKTGLSEFDNEVAARLQSNIPDVIHSHFAHIGWQYQTLASRLKLPHIVSFYGMDYEYIPHKSPIWKKRYQDLFISAQMFLCEGAHGASVLEKLGCPSNKIAIARLGVDVSKIPIYVRKKVPDSLKLIQIASFREKKGHIYAIRAFAKAALISPNMSLTLVGSGDDLQTTNILSEIENSGVSEKILLLPEINFAHLHDFLKDYHVFIHPSQFTSDKDCEGGAPVVLLDAQATGMPVISTFHCDIPEEVVDGKTGMLCREHDVEAISSAITTFCRMSQAEFSIYANNARNHVTENYNCTDNAKAMVELYKKLCSPSPTST